MTRLITPAERMQHCVDAARLARPVLGRLARDPNY